MVWLRNSLLAVLCFFLIPLTVSAQTSTPSLRIGLIPEMNVFKQMERFAPLADYLTEQTGYRVDFIILSRYGNIIERFTEEKMDGAFLGSFTGALAIQQLGLVPLVRPVNLDGESTYHAHIYARKDSGIKTVADMKGKKFAFVEKATTAGYLYPLAYLEEHGVVDIDTFFSEYYFAGSHDASLHAVLEGQADVGASKNTVYDWVMKTDPRVDAEIDILASSSKVPSNGLCVRADLSGEIKQKLKKILLELDKSPEGLEVLEKFKAQRFVETNSEDYLPVFEMAKKAGIKIRTYQYLNE